MSVSLLHFEACCLGFALSSSLASFILIKVKQKSRTLLCRRAIFVLWFVHLLEFKSDNK
jgi:hypothetical protein